MREQFIDRTFSRSSQAMIDTANGIIAEYLAQGFTLTLRQLWYQFVARGILKNKFRNYKRLGSVISDARLAGEIDWRAIEDRTRELVSVNHWDDPPHLLKACADQYRLDKWRGQLTRVEVWIEKEALVGVIEQVCADLDIAYFACRGYVSQSEQYAAGKRFEQYILDDAQNVVVLHLGDHDPSGIDMTRDTFDRLSMFTGRDIEVRRIALNMDQVETYSPPPNYAKVTDSRYKAYVDKYGEDSWELDALEPRVVVDLIRDNVEPYIDRELWEEVVAEEERGTTYLRAAKDNWSQVCEFIDQSFELE